MDIVNSTGWAEVRGFVVVATLACWFVNPEGERKKERVYLVTKLSRSFYTYTYTQKSFITVMVYMTIMHFCTLHRWLVQAVSLILGHVQGV